MSDSLPTKNLPLSFSIRLPCAALVLGTLSACGSGSGTGTGTDTDTGADTDTDSGVIPADINNEILRVDLDDDLRYQWRVRAITETATGPWSTKFLVTTDPVSDDFIDVSYISPEATTTDQFGNQLFFDDDLFDDNVEQTTVPGKTDFSGVPLFTWTRESDADAYEIEIVQVESLQRVGLFQYAQSALCIEDTCEIVLENTGSEALDLPPIPLIGQTVAQGDAPFEVVLPSPVLDTTDLESYSHDWSIEGRFTDYPDTPEFRNVFSDAGSYTVNVLVSSVDGRSGYSFASVNVLEPSASEASGIDALSPEVPEQAVIEETPLAAVEEPEPAVDTTIPEVAAAQPEPAVENIMPEVAAAEPEPAVEEAAAVEPEPVVEITVAEVTPAEPEPAEPIQPIEEEVVTPATEPESSTDEIDSGNITVDENLTAPVVTVVEPEPAVIIPVPLPAEEVEEPVAEEVEPEDTVTEPVQADGWDNSLPLGGRALGVVTSGITTGNSLLTKYKSARRFLATRSGTVQGFGYQNRMLTDQQVEDRAKTRDKYKDMVAAVGIDPARGSYMLGNAYAVGNGGLQEVSLQTDDNGNPSGDIIAIAEPYVPRGRDTNEWRIENFKSNDGYVQAGQVYWLVWENLNPPSHSLGNLSASQARNSEANAGAISLNGPRQGDQIDPENPRGPFLRNFGYLLSKSSEGDSWRLSNVMPFYSLVYTDGVEVGDTYSHLQGQGDYRYTVQGDVGLRQQFTWKYKDTSVDRIATRFGHTSSANGKPMDIVIRDESSSVIATATVSFDAELKAAAKDDDYFRQYQTRHSVAFLSSSVTLETGKKYFVEYLADSGAGFIMSPAVTGAAGGTADQNVLADGFAQQSTDGGRSWKSLNKFPESDMPFYLIPVGVPTNTPIP